MAQALPRKYSAGQATLFPPTSSCRTSTICDANSSIGRDSSQRQMSVILSVIVLAIAFLDVILTIWSPNWVQVDVEVLHSGKGRQARGTDLFHKLCSYRALRNQIAVTRRWTYPRHPQLKGPKDNLSFYKRFQYLCNVGNKVLQIFADPSESKTF